MLVIIRSYRSAHPWFKVHRLLLGFIYSGLCLFILNPILIKLGTIYFSKLTSECWEIVIALNYVINDKISVQILIYSFPNIITPYSIRNSLILDCI